MEDGTSAHGAEQPSDEGGLWIDEGSSPPGARSNRRRAGIVARGGGVCGAHRCPRRASGRLRTRNRPRSASRNKHPRHGERRCGEAVGPRRPERHDGLGELRLHVPAERIAVPEQRGPEQRACNGPGCPTAPDPQTTEVQGSGTINTNPMAMAASAAISTNGVSGLQVGVRVDPTTVWEVGYADNGLTPVSSDAGAGGSPLAGFAGLVEGTLGSREGPVAMMGMASPTGYLDLVQPAVTSATEVGTATVDGVAVTQYQLTIDPGSLATAPGTSSEEQSAINAAIQALTSDRAIGPSTTSSPLTRRGSSVSRRPR